MAENDSPQTEQEWDEMLTRAEEAGRRAAKSEPRALAAHYEAGTRTVTVHLRSGASFTFPVGLIPELAHRTNDELAQVEVYPTGSSLIWRGLDVHLGVVGLTMQALGSEAWLQEIRALFASAGGRARSAAKAAAARANGKRGGRPRKAIPRSDIAAQ